MYKERRHWINALLELKNRLKQQKQIKEWFKQTDLEVGIAIGIETAIKEVNTIVNELLLESYELDNEISKWN